MGRNAYVLENGYSCDSGSVIGGKVVRYPILCSGQKGKAVQGNQEKCGIRLGQGEEITPGCGHESQTEDATKQQKISKQPVFLEYGFSGISTAATKPGLLICSIISKAVHYVVNGRKHGAKWQRGCLGKS